MALWTPAEIATVGWWDAADTASYFDATSGGNVITTHNALVRRWSDKSGNASNATQASGFAPRIQLTSNQLNSLPVMRFAAAGDSQFNVDASANFVPDLLSFCVVMRTSSADTNRGVLGRWGTNGNFWLAIHRSADLLIPAIVVRDSSNLANFTAAATSSLINGEGRLFAGVFNTGGSSQISIDGTVEGSSSQLSNRSGTSVMTIGSYTTGANATGLTGDIAEVVMWRSAVTNTRQRVEGYLAWKWGIQANLPIDHPYKNAAPRTGALVTILRQHYAAQGAR